MPDRGVTTGLALPSATLCIRSVVFDLLSAAYFTASLHGVFGKYCWKIYAKQRLEVKFPKGNATGRNTASCKNAQSKENWIIDIFFSLSEQIEFLEKWPWQRNTFLIYWNFFKTEVTQA